MDLYHSWIYRHAINTEWFMWTVVIAVLGINILMPLTVWYHLRGKQIIQKFREQRKQR